MPIQTVAKEYETNAEFSDVKHPGSELQLQIQKSDGTVLGSVRVSRAESRDATVLSFETRNRRRSLKDMLDVSGIENDPPDFEKKFTLSRTFTGERANIHIRPAGVAAFLVNLEANRKYKSLDVMLTP